MGLITDIPAAQPHTGISSPNGLHSLIIADLKVYLVSKEGHPLDVLTVFQPKYYYVWKAVIISKNTSKIVSFPRCLWLPFDFGWKTAAQTNREMFFDTLAFF